MQAFQQCHLGCSGKLIFFTVRLPLTSPSPLLQSHHQLKVWTTSALFLGSSSHIPARNPSLPSAALVTSPLQPLTGWSSHMAVAASHSAWPSPPCFLCLDHLAVLPLDEITAPGFVFCFIYLFDTRFFCLARFVDLLLPHALCSLPVSRVSTWPTAFRPAHVMPLLLLSLKHSLFTCAFLAHAKLFFLLGNFHLSFGVC